MAEPEFAPRQSDSRACNLHENGNLYLSVAYYDSSLFFLTSCNIFAHLPSVHRCRSVLFILLLLNVGDSIGTCFCLSLLILALLLFPTELQYKGSILLSCIFPLSVALVISSTGLWSIVIGPFGHRSLLGHGMEVGVSFCQVKTKQNKKMFSLTESCCC